MMGVRSRSSRAPGRTVEAVFEHDVHGGQTVADPIGKLPLLFRSEAFAHLDQEPYQRIRLVTLEPIDFQEERYDQAKENLTAVLELNERSADAYYWLGNIYEKDGDIISARKEWRRVLNIDPKHIGAIDKLY